MLKMHYSWKLKRKPYHCHNHVNDRNCTWYMYRKLEGINIFLEQLKLKPLQPPAAGGADGVPLLIYHLGVSLLELCFLQLWLSLPAVKLDIRFYYSFICSFIRIYVICHSPTYILICDLFTLCVMSKCVQKRTPFGSSSDWPHYRGWLQTHFLVRQRPVRLFPGNPAVVSWASLT